MMEVCSCKSLIMASIQAEKNCENNSLNVQCMDVILNSWRLTRVERKHANTLNKAIRNKAIREISRAKNILTI